LRWKPFISVKDMYIFIPDVDIEKVREEMIRKTEEKINKLKGKK
jgi:hypothetical protein